MREARCVCGEKMIQTVEQIAALAAKKKPKFNVPWRPVLQSFSALYDKAVVGCKLAEPCMLAALVLRESGGQNIFQKGVLPGPGCGVGLCQITYGVDWSDIINPTYPGVPGLLLDPATNLKVAAHYFLEPALEKFPNDHVAAFASFNLGSNAVQNELIEGLSPDAWTTGHDYGIDVFTSWINFSAASMGIDVAWTQYRALHGG
jgi:hypothetical protein